MPVSLRLVLGAGCIVVAIAAPVCAQSVYSWKDAKGVTHYSDSPPPGSANPGKVRTVEVGPAPVATPSAVKPAEDAKVARAPTPPAPDPAAVKAANEQRAAACKQAQDNLAVLNTNQTVLMDKDGDGKNEAVLTAEERTQQTTDMQSVVTANCAATTP